MLKSFRARFVDRDEPLSPDSGDAFIDGLVAAYRDYWAHTLVRDVAPVDGERSLDAGLERLLGEHFPASASEPGEDVPQLGRLIREAGYGYYDPSAPPFRELLLWKRQETRRYRVALTDETRTVQVVFVDGMVSPGWKHFASLGLARTSGWIDAGKLFCVNSAYPRTSEYFEVSFLKHESRHLADYERFPGLSASDLEYRAKLTELAYSSWTLSRLLEDFSSKASLNSGSAHAEANHRVTRDLYLEMHGKPFPQSGAPWSGVNVSEVNRSARRLLDRNTEVLRAASARPATQPTGQMQPRRPPARP